MKDLSVWYIFFDICDAPTTWCIHIAAQIKIKCEHFLDFLFNNKLLHDIVYSVTNTKFDNGNYQKIMHNTLVAKYLHTYYSVHPPPPLSATGGGGGGGWTSNQIFKKGGGGLTGPQLLEGGCWERGVWIFSGGLQFSQKK